MVWITYHLVTHTLNDIKPLVLYFETRRSSWDKNTSSHYRYAPGFKGQHLLNLTKSLKLGADCTWIRCLDRRKLWPQTPREPLPGKGREFLWQSEISQHWVKYFVDCKVNFPHFKWHTLISKYTSGFTSNTLLIRFPIMLPVYTVYRMHKVLRRMVKYVHFVHLKCQQVVSHYNRILLKRKINTSFIHSLTEHS